MVSKSHFKTASDWRVKLTVGSVIVVPHATGRGDDEDANSLDNGVRPESAENKEIKS